MDRSRVRSCRRHLTYAFRGTSRTYSADWRPILLVNLGLFAAISEDGDAACLFARRRYVLLCSFCAHSWTEWRDARAHQVALVGVVPPRPEHCVWNPFHAGGTLSRHKDLTWNSLLRKFDLFRARGAGLSAYTDLSLELAAIPVLVCILSFAMKTVPLDRLHVCESQFRSRSSR